MSRRVKVKKKKSKEIMKMIKDGDLNSMFNKMLGVDHADPKIVEPKYYRCRKYVSILAGFMEKFATYPPLHKLCPNEVKNLDQILQFSKKLMELIGDKPLNYVFDRKEISSIYLKFKNHDITKTIFVVHSQIKKIAKHIEDANKLSDRFIIDEPGFEVYPFKKISKLNLFNIWAKDPSKDAINYVLKFLHQVHKLTKMICKIVIQVDVDIKKFSQILVECISKAEKQIPGCRDAFRKIKNAVSLLEGNFGGYYEDFVKTANPGIIFQSFIEDVSNDQKNTNLKLITQFRKIISHFQKAPSEKEQNPQMKKMMQMLNSQLNMASDVQEDDSESVDGKCKNPNEQTGDSLDKTGDSLDKTGDSLDKTGDLSDKNKEKSKNLNSSPNKIISPNMDVDSENQISEMFNLLVNEKEVGDRVSELAASKKV